MKDDDELRFGDLDASREGGDMVDSADNLIELLKRLFILLVMGYVLVQVVGILFDIPIPF